MRADVLFVGVPVVGKTAFDPQRFAAPPPPALTC